MYILRVTDAGISLEIIFAYRLLLLAHKIHHEPFTRNFLALRSTETLNTPNVNTLHADSNFNRSWLPSYRNFVKHSNNHSRQIQEEGVIVYNI